MSQDFTNPATPSPAIVIPTPTPAVLRFLVHYNPFYLLSACCMMIGLFMLNNGLDWSPLPKRTLLNLIVTLAAYEIVLTALGVFLMRRGIVRDGLFVLILEAFFLADAGFLNMEVYTANVSQGAIVNGILFVLAIAKLTLLIAVGLRIKPGFGLVGFVSAQLALLYAIPGVFAHLAFDEGKQRGDLSDWAIYAAWYAFPLMAILGVFLRAQLRDRWSTFTPAQAIVARAFMTMPAISLLAHLILANWVYEVPFHLVNIAPLFLGSAVIYGHWTNAIETRSARANAQFWACVWAVVFSVPAVQELSFDAPHGWTIAPLRIVMFCVTLIAIDGWWCLRRARFLILALVCASGCGLGSSVGEMTEMFVNGLRAIVRFIRRFVPEGQGSWGAVSVAASFVLLILGAFVSLIGRHLQPIDVLKTAEDSTVRHIPIAGE